MNRMNRGVDVENDIIRVRVGYSRLDILLCTGGGICDDTVLVGNCGSLGCVLVGKFCFGKGRGFGHVQVGKPGHESRTLTNIVGQ